MLTGWVFFFFGIWLVISAAIGGLNHWTNVVDFVIGLVIAVSSFWRTKKGRDH